MSGEYQKHTTHTDALDTLGSIIGTTEGRDAIHLAVFPVEAACRLLVGEDVGLDADGRAVPVDASEGVGIVDPFLKDSVARGERFWLVVYPRQITSLRHVWEHPAFPPSGETGQPAEPTAAVDAPVSKEASEQWLRDWLKQHNDNPGFDAVMAVIRDGEWVPEDERQREWMSGSNRWGYLHFSGTDAHGEIPAEFWAHAEMYLGTAIPVEDRAEGFSCSC